MKYLILKKWLRLNTFTCTTFTCATSAEASALVAALNLANSEKDSLVFVAAALNEG